MCPLTVILSLPDGQSQHKIQLEVKIHFVINYK